MVRKCKLFGCPIGYINRWKGFGEKIYEENQIRKPNLKKILGTLENDHVVT